VRFAPVPVSVPFAGCETTLNVTASLSMSEPVSVIATLSSSSTVTDCAFATGASLIALTVIVTVDAVEATWPSLTVKVKLSAPL
jgi:hypothetical protein